MKSYILNLISIILGFIYVIFLFWNRLIRERLPYQLCGNYNNDILAIFCALFLSSVILFIYYLRQILQKQSKYTIISKILKITYVQNIVNFFIKYILKAPYNSYIWIYNKINLLPAVEKLGAHVWNRDPHKDPYKIFILCCSCRFIVVLCFLIDVFIFHKFNYFYKSLILLLIYLICNTIIFVLKDISFDNRKHITDNYITVENDLTTFSFIVDFKFSYDGDRSDQMLNNHFNVWVCYLANCMFADKYYEYVDKYNTFINVLYYGIFTIGWGYIVFQFYI